MARARYVLAVGDLSINEMLTIARVCREHGPPGVARKVADATEAVWQGHCAYATSERLFAEYCAEREAKRARRKKSP